MTVTLEQFIKQLHDSGLMSAEEMTDVHAGLPQHGTVESLAESLYRQNILTKYQITRVIQGKAKSLQLGNYTVIDKIGQGGMGLVVKARHRVMQRIVAIKVLSSATVKSPDAIKRFHREVEAAARLNHPHIVAAFDADQANGTHFLVMEYVDGYDFAKLVRTQGPLSLKRAIEFLTQAGRGLEFAHTHGVVHRDIKPANLLIDRLGTVKILDLGLARLENSEQPTDLTSSGQIMGTIDYMAPEQAIDMRTADHRADIYSFGCTLWYLLTGKSVYGGETALAKLLEHRDGQIPTLLGRSEELQSTNPRAVAIDHVFRKMLAKRPDQRFQSMAEVLLALEGCLSGKPAAPEAAPALPSADEEPLTSFLSFLASAVDPERDLAPGARSSGHTATLDLDVISRDTTQFVVSPSQAVARTVVQRFPARPWLLSSPVWLGVGLGGLALLIVVLVISSLTGNSSTRPVAPVVPVVQKPEIEASPVDSIPPFEPLGMEVEAELSDATGDHRNRPFNRRKNFQLAFNGVDSYVQVESLKYTHGNPYTCEAWFTPIGIQNSISDPLIWTGPRWIAIWEQNRAFGTGLTGSGATAIFSSRVPAERQPLDRVVPVHVAGVWKGAEQTLYVNGRQVELTNTNSVAFPETRGGLFLGGAPLMNIGHERWYRGGIDEVRISRGTRYRMKFTPQRRFPDQDSDTLALYHLDEVDGATAFDSSGQGHHGHVVNAKWIPAPPFLGIVPPDRQLLNP